MTTGMSESIESGSQQSMRAFLGWRIVGVGFIANLLSGAITLSAFGNFVDPVSTAFGVPRSTIGLGVSITILVMGLLGPFAGAWLDRGWARSMMAAGSLIAGAGLILLSQATTLWQAAVLFCGAVADAGGKRERGGHAGLGIWRVRRRAYPHRTHAFTRGPGD